MAIQDFLTVPCLDASTIDRIFSKITVDSNTECWIWEGSKDAKGYGHIRYAGKIELMHRFMYAWLIDSLPRIPFSGIRGYIPILDHIVCDNPSCCNPFHLRFVFNTENLRRTMSPPAINSRKTHCIHGHLLPPPINGCRQCLICKREFAAKYRRRKGILPWEEHLAKRRSGV